MIFVTTDDAQSVLTIAQGLGLTMDSEQAELFAQRFATELHAGVFGASEFSFRLAYEEFVGNCPPYFDVREYYVHTEKRGGVRITQARVKVFVEDEEEFTVDEGTGPIDAFARALHKALQPHYETLGGIKLVSYSLQAIDVRHGETAAPVIVLAKFAFSDGSEREIAAVSDNQDEAGLLALIHGYRWALYSEQIRSKDSA